MFTYPREHDLKRVVLASVALICVLATLFLSGCFSHQRYDHFQARTPLPEQTFLVIGFLGGREKWDSPREGVRILALRLRERKLRGVEVETCENVQRELALRLVQNALDRNSDGTLQDAEKASARIIVYGQSFGGAAVVKFANQLNTQRIRVLLTIQVDSVGRHDDVIPQNVRRAANLFQRNGRFIKGEPVIRPQDAGATEIIGNFEFDYSHSPISLSGVPWYKRIFREAHAQMNLDPEVWQKVENLILEEIHRAEK